jgi:dTDP-4-amino-4,6-dideoxygalactose transaminase
VLPQKQEIFRRLAITGGRPAFDEKLHVGRPNLGDKERLLRRVSDVLESGWLTNNGPYLVEFEQRIAALTGARHCIAVCNATIGLEIAIRALEMSGEVIVPSFTFAATAHALQWQGITPVFCDVDPVTHSLDPRDVERCITSRTTGIIGVHLWGNACDTNALEKIAQRRGLKLLFDAAHAFGCSHDGQMIGNFGQAEVFSFHATKFCNSFEGGAITTNDDELADRFRVLRNFGMLQDGVAHEVGTNGKMSEISAAMGITSLESLNEFVAINRANYLAYKKHLDGTPGLKLFQHNEGGRNNFQYVIVEVDDAVAGVSRDELQKILQAENVMAKSYFSPGCHRLNAYRRRGGHLNRRLPVTERLADRTLALPTGAAIGEKDIRIIGEIIATAIGRAGRVVQERTPQTRGKQAEEYARIGAKWGGELIWGALQVGLLAGM